MSKGNTVGKVVGEVPTAHVPAKDANPPIEDGLGTQVLDGVQLGLDVIGLIPGAGEIADLANAGISAARGDWIGAGLSLASAIPFAGWGAAAGKIGRKGAKAVAKEAAERAAKEAAEKAAKEAAEKAAKSKVAKDAQVKGLEKLCGTVAKYTKAPKKKGVLERDHLPSGAALKEAAKNELMKQGIWTQLSPKEQKSILNSVYNNATTISVPPDIHAEGRTYKGKNKNLKSEDGLNLNAAFKKDAAALKKAMKAKNHPCLKALTEGLEVMESIDYDAYVRDAVSTHPVIKALTP